MSPLLFPLDRADEYFGGEPSLQLGSRLAQLGLSQVFLHPTLFPFALKGQ